MAKRKVTYELDKNDKRILSDLDKVVAERRKLEKREASIFKRAGIAQLPVRLVLEHIPDMSLRTVHKRMTAHRK